MSIYFTENNGWIVLISIARVFASWDGEEYGLVGSTEWLEEYITWASPNVVAYLNVDIAAAGPLFALEANPELHDLLFETMKKIPAPNTPGKTIFDNWTTAGSKIGVLGAHSDFTAFVQAGMTAVSAPPSLPAVSMILTSSDTG